MSQIELTFPDGSVRSVASGTTGLEIAKSISEGLARKALGVKLDDEILDLSRPLTANGKIRIITPSNDDPDALYLLRHSCCHVLAEAICDLFPGTKLAYGPAIDKGFYYDLMSPTPIKEEDFPKIEKRMKEIIKEDRPFTRVEFSAEEGLARVKDNKYKVDNAERAVEREGKDCKLSFYVTGEPGKNWEDLCGGPHVPSTGKLKYFKVLSTSGAYWHGDQNSDQLTRVYGTCFADKEGLETYVKLIEEAAKRDHRKIGKEMDLYHVEDHSPGMVFWHPKGTKMVNALKDYIRGKIDRRGYLEVITPEIVNKVLWIKSGHADKYNENMFKTMAERRGEWEEAEVLWVDTRELSHRLTPGMSSGNYHHIDTIAEYRNAGLLRGFGPSSMARLILAGKTGPQVILDVEYGAREEDGVLKWHERYNPEMPKETPMEKVYRLDAFAAGRNDHGSQDCKVSRHGKETCL